LTFNERELDIFTHQNCPQSANAALYALAVVRTALKVVMVSAGKAIFSIPETEVPLEFKPPPL
jgi:hypothetical protein